MVTQILPRDQWRSLLDSLDKQHEHWFVTVEIHGQELSSWDEDIREFPLQSIGAQLTGSPDDFISITFGSAHSVQIRKIPAPCQVRLGWTQKGSQQALAIESAEGATLLARFRHVPVPDLPHAGIRLHWNASASEGIRV